MIKVANNIQRMLEKKAQGDISPPYIARPADGEMGPPSPYIARPADALSPYIARPADAPRLAPENFYAPLQQRLQNDTRMMHRDINRGLRGAQQGYKRMVGPDGIPLLLSRAGQFAADTQAAAPLLAQDYNNILNLQTQGINQFGDIGGYALDYVDAFIPEAQGYARNIVDAGGAGLNQVAPQMAAKGQAIQNQAAGLGSKIKNIGQNLLKNPLGR
jgi:hypothetical protein